METIFDFERDERGAEVPFSQPHLALLRAEDAAALVAHTAKLRRQILRLSSAATGTLSRELCDLSPQRATQISLTLISMNNTASLICDMARGLDELAREAHAACYQSARPSHRCAAPRPADVGENETARDDDAPDVEAAPVPVARPKVPVSDECAKLRRQFWAVAHKVALSSLEAKRDDRLAAIATHIDRPLDSINQMSPSEWNSVIYAMEDGSLTW